ncbi:DUF3817 domain-containing protein [Nocardia donostiensis]|uniref:DUF3817 domain-containing protein n=1 Tax=Nocardia donostiensis TaxID=1538463 RepID=A0A1V2TCJ3_9NOCA|nr:DUF3817 domain-containing protein [Nocardia donostiensis]ONM47227.1 hypothetical protein B0T46_18235 [Nocardia donostiensis]OQS16531.1 hypothetical protein B0T36_02200 [Nocardia donostiensis]OQS21006.1 hypothetical protein B0T44_08165 [Nocardia donostiensis]
MVAMGNVFDLSTAAKKFRFVAILEAVSWGLLIVGMVCKRLPDPIMWPVKVFGMTHGAAFVLFLLITVLTARELSWSLKTTLLALVSSIPPFCTVVFEVWAVRTGKLGELSNRAANESPETVRVSS